MAWCLFECRSYLASAECWDQLGSFAMAPLLMTSLSFFSFPLSLILSPHRVGCRVHGGTTYYSSSTLTSDDL